MIIKMINALCGFVDLVQRLKCRRADLALQNCFPLTKYCLILIFVILDVYDV